MLRAEEEVALDEHGAAGADQYAAGGDSGEVVVADDDLGGERDVLEHQLGVVPDGLRHGSGQPDHYLPGVEHPGLPHTECAQRQ